MSVNRWAAPVQNEIARVVAENLVALLGTARATMSPQTLAAGADYRAAIEVQPFESTPGQAATLEAVWTGEPPKTAGRGQVRTRLVGARGDCYVIVCALASASVRVDGTFSVG